MAQWTFDPVHSYANFSARHMMVTIVRGQFSNITGAVHFDPAKPEASSVDVKIDASTVNSGMEQRDGHLKSPDFLDVANFPTIDFKSTRVVVTGESTADVHGDLTIRGTTRPVVLKTELLGVTKGLQGDERAGFTSTTKINREDFGLTWNVALEAGGWLVGKEISITLDVEVIKVTEQVPA